MSRYLFAPMPFVGHVNPSLPLAAELVRRGHDVRWYATEKFRPTVERIGARLVPVVRPVLIEDGREDELMPEWKDLKGLPQVRYSLKRVFIDVAPGVLADLEAEHAREPFDIVVGDETAVGAALFAQRHGLPWAVAACSCVTLPSADASPFGLGLPYVPGPLGRLRNRLLHRLSERVVFADVNEHYRNMREGLSFPPTGRTFFTAALDADLVLQSTVPGFEYPYTDLPAAHRFIGAFVPEPPADWAPPAWWGDLDGERPVVLVTQGTVANQYDQLVRPALRALAGEDVLVVVTTGGKPPEALAMDLPANARVAQFVPYAHLMPKVDALVTNGGFGTVQIALRHGVPLAVYGNSEDKMEIVARVRHNGTGVGRKTISPTEAELREAVRALLRDPRYRRRAQALQAELDRHDPARLAGDALESLAHVPVRGRAMMV